MIDKADSIEEEKEEDVEEETLASSTRTSKESDEILEARGRSSSSQCGAVKCDKETFSADAKNETKSVDTKPRKSSIVAKKSFESESESASPPTSASSQSTTLRAENAATSTPTCKRKSIDTQKSDDDVANAQSIHVETQQDETVAQEIEMNIDVSKESKMRKASRDETHRCCERVALRQKSIDDKPRHIFVPQHTISQEDDYDISLVSGLLPGLSFVNDESKLFHLINFLPHRLCRTSANASTLDGTIG